MNSAQFRAEADPLMRMVNDQFDAIFGGDIVGNIRGATNDLRESNDAQHRNEQYAANNFSMDATAEECLQELKNFADRLEFLEFDISKLEDAIGVIAKQVDDSGERLCSQCNGSGEGQHDGTRCRACKGRGTEFKEAA
jgi:DnaJ-class molecular chaperone